MRTLPLFLRTFLLFTRASMHLPDSNRVSLIFPFKPHYKTPSKNPSENLLQSPSQNQPFLESEGKSLGHSDLSESKFRTKFPLFSGEKRPEFRRKRDFYEPPLTAMAQVPPSLIEACVLCKVAWCIGREELGNKAHETSLTQNDVLLESWGLRAPKCYGGSDVRQDFTEENLTPAIKSTDLGGCRGYCLCFPSGVGDREEAPEAGGWVLLYWKWRGAGGCVSGRVSAGVGGAKCFVWGPKFPTGNDTEIVLGLLVGGGPGVVTEIICFSSSSCRGPNTTKCAQPHFSWSKWHRSNTPNLHLTGVRTSRTGKIMPKCVPFRWGWPPSSPTQPGFANWGGLGARWKRSQKQKRPQFRRPG